MERGDLTGAPVVPKEGGDNPPSASRDGNVVRTSNNAPEYVESGASYRAIYDYTAADDDEISFKQGDSLIRTHILKIYVTETRHVLSQSESSKNKIYFVRLFFYLDSDWLRTSAI